MPSHALCGIAGVAPSTPSAIGIARDGGLDQQNQKRREPFPGAGEASVPRWEGSRSLLGSMLLASLSNIGCSFFEISVASASAVNGSAVELEAVLADYLQRTTLSKRYSARLLASRALLEEATAFARSASPWIAARDWTLRHQALAGDHPRE